MIYNSAIGLGKWEQQMIKLDGDEQPHKSKLTWLAVMVLVFVLGAMTVGAVNAYMPAGTYTPLIYKDEFPKRVEVYRNPFGIRYAIVYVRTFSEYSLVRVGDKARIEPPRGSGVLGRSLGNETSDPADPRYDAIRVRTFVMLRDGKEVQRLSFW